MAKKTYRSAGSSGKLPKITDSFVERVARPDQAAIFFFDKSRSGFGVKIYPANQNTNRPSKRVYGVRVTIEGNKKRWITIGAHGNPWTAEKARDEANRIRLNIEQGKPPFDHRQDRKSVLYRLKDLAEAYFAEYDDWVTQGRRSQNTLTKYKRQWEENVPSWLKKLPVSDLKSSVFQKALKEISRLKSARPRPIEGNRTLAMLSAMLGWVMDQDPDERKGLTENHCDGVQRNPENETRGVWMEDADQSRLIAFLLDPRNRKETWWEEEKRARKAAKHQKLKRKDQFQPPYLITHQMANALLLLFISGLRSWEVMALRWEDIHVRSHTLEVEQTKRGATPSNVRESKRIFISEEVQTVLDQIPKTSEWAFPTNGKSKKSQSGHIENMQDSWERIRKHLKLPEIRLHDYRHTAASEIGDHPDMSVQDLKYAFGWKTEQTAMRYLHSRAKAREKRVQQITSTRMKRIGNTLESAVGHSDQNPAIATLQPQPMTPRKEKAIRRFSADKLRDETAAPDEKLQVQPSEDSSL